MKKKFSTLLLSLVLVMAVGFMPITELNVFAYDITVVNTEGCEHTYNDDGFCESC